MLATLGQPLFEPLTNAPTAKGEKELFFCKGSGADGVGEYTTEGFVVHKGSRGRAEIVASIQGTSNERLRNQLALDGVLSAQNGMLVFTRDQRLAGVEDRSRPDFGRRQAPVGEFDGLAGAIF